MLDNFNWDSGLELVDDAAMSECVGRTRAQRRKNSVAKALRKQRIDKMVSPVGESPIYENLHQFSKNKIHCSCALCRRKTRDKGVGGRKFQPTVTDARKIYKMDFSYKEDFLLAEQE